MFSKTGKSTKESLRQLHKHLSDKYGKNSHVSANYYSDANHKKVIIFPNRQGLVHLFGASPRRGVPRRGVWSNNLRENCRGHCSAPLSARRILVCANGRAIDNRADL